jgi:hypothetical protein
MQGFIHRNLGLCARHWMAPGPAPFPHNKPVTNRARIDKSAISVLRRLVPTPTLDSGDPYEKAGARTLNAAKMRVSFDIPSEPHETPAESLVITAYRLAYLLKLCGAVVVTYGIARAIA